MKPVVIIKQPFGTGDHIFCQSIAHHFIEKGYEVLWPVLKHMVQGMQKAYPKITWVDADMVPVNLDDKRRYDEGHFHHLPLRYAESLLGRPYKMHMVSKYDYLGLDWKDWKKHAMPKRYPYKESMLFSLLGIEDGEPFNFISTTFGSNFNHKIEVTPSNNYKRVELRPIEGISLFDWCEVIKRATTIHAVSSSTLYLFELLELAATEVHIYNRTPIEKNLDYVRFLFSKNYILHE